MEYSELIVSFLISRPLISVNGLEAEAGTPQLTIAHALKGRRNIPEKHQKKIIQILLNYGFTY